jgi:hypothetical protein
MEEVVPALVAELPELVLLLLWPRLDRLHVDKDARLRVLLDRTTALPETHAPTTQFFPTFCLKGGRHLVFKPRLHEPDDLPLLDVLGRKPP